MIEDILKKDVKYKRVGQHFNFVESSVESKFYDDFYNHDYATISKRQLITNSKELNIDKDLNRVLSLLKNWLQPSSIICEIGGTFFQERSAFIYKYYDNYFPLDLSVSNIKNYTDFYKKTGISANATNLPFVDKSLDCVITHTFLEHVATPKDVINEIARVLKPNGYVIHVDAWHCRWWHSLGIYHSNSYTNLSTKNKLTYIGIYIYEMLMLSHLTVIFSRLVNILFRKKSKFLQYSKLKPNYTLNLGKDEDAAVNIDQVELMRYYNTLGFKNIISVNFWQKLFYNDTIVIMQKNNK